MDGLQVATEHQPSTSDMNMYAIARFHLKTLHFGVISFKIFMMWKDNSLLAPIYIRRTAPNPEELRSRALLIEEVNINADIILTAKIAFRNISVYTIWIWSLCNHAGLS